LTPENLSSFTSRLHKDVAVASIMVDEVHCTTMSGGQRTAMRTISSSVDAVRDINTGHGLPRPVVAGFTATLRASHVNDVQRYIGLTQPVVLREPVLRPAMHHSFKHKGSTITASATDIATQIRGDLSETSKTVIFTLKRAEAESMVKHLQAKLPSNLRDKVGCYIGIPQKANDDERKVLEAARKATLELFIRGDLYCLVATNCLAQGVDLPSVYRVINYGLAPTTTHYLQQGGRGGRPTMDEFWVLTYFNINDFTTLSYLSQSLSLTDKQAWEEEKEQMVRLAFGRTCRARCLSEWFGDPVSLLFVIHLCLCTSLFSHICRLFLTFLFALSF
jgi:superfamily II DNA helicase RecQ